MRLVIRALFFILAILSGAEAHAQTLPSPKFQDITAMGNLILQQSSQIQWGTGASASWAGNTVDTSTACPIGAPIQEGNFYAAHCYQFTTTPSFASPQGGIVSTFVAGANTQSGGNEAVNLFLATYGQSGSPNTWSISAENVSLPGAMGGPVAELDYVNETCDPGPALSPSVGCGLLGKTFHGITIDGIGGSISGVFPGNAAILIEGSGTGPMWHDGLVFAGSDTMVDHNIFDATSVPTSYAIFGAHSIGIDCFFGVFSSSCLRLAANQKIVMNGSNGRSLLDNGNFLTTIGDFLSAGYAGTKQNGGASVLAGCADGLGGTLLGWNRGSETQEADIYSCQATGAPSNQGGLSVYIAATDGTIGTKVFSVDGLGNTVTPGTATHGLTTTVVGPPGSTRGILLDSVVSSANLARWTLAANNSAESGGDAGSDLVLCRFHDDGSLNDCPLIVQRATGGLTVVDGISFLSGGISSNNVSLPTSNPHVLGQWWNNAGVINVSGG